MMISVRSALSLRPQLVRFGSSAVKYRHDLGLEQPQASLSPSVIYEKAIPTETHASTLSNGISFACVEDHSPISTFTIAVRAGSRFEKAGSFGHSHILKHFAFEDTKKRSRIILSRSFQDAGANLHVELNRELLTISAEFLREDLDQVVHLLSSIVTSPDFAFHRTERTKASVVSELAHADSDAKFVDLIHKTAFRTGLGNAIHPSVSMVESATSESVEAFANEAFKASNIAIVATGVDHAHLSGLCGEEFGSLKGDKTTNVSKYQGGETVLNALDETNRFSIAYEAPSQSKYALSVLQQILGGRPFVSGGKGASRVQGVETFHFQYSETGLFGFFSKKDSASIDSAVAELKKLVSSLISELELNGAKFKAQVAALVGTEKRLALSGHLSRQLLTSTSITHVGDWVKNLGSVTASDVQKLAQSLVQSKPTVVSSSD